MVSRLLFLRLLVALQAAVAAPVAEQAEHDLDGRCDQEGHALHAGVDLVLLHPIFWLDVLDDLDEVGVASELHDGEDEEEVDADEGGHAAVEAAESCQESHFIN